MNYVAPEDGLALARIDRSEDGWGPQVAQEINEAIYRLAAQHGWRHLVLWLEEDAWQRMIPHLDFNIQKSWKPGVEIRRGVRKDSQDVIISFKSEQTPVS